MTRPTLAMFCQSLASDWNHGNAHFLRGLLADLHRRGWRLDVLEPADSWSRQNLERDHGPAASLAYREAYPQLDSRRYDPAGPDPDDAVRDADVVIVHEWTDPAVVAAVGRAHATLPNPGGRVLLFHDTHHRSVSAPAEMRRYDLAGYDGVIAFGEPVRAWHRQAHRLPSFVVHEAADPDLFRPMPGVAPETDVVWVGNWGDDERTAELHEFLIEPVAELGLTATVHGVRYPDEAIAALERAGIRYAGYLPNHRVPDAFARGRATVHVPRRYYAGLLPGIPTIRPFEAVACGIPIVSAPWQDTDGLFDPGDVPRAADKRAMKEALRRVLDRPDEARRRASAARRRLLGRHTCRHRADEILGIVDTLRDGGAAEHAKRAGAAI